MRSDKRYSNVTFGKRVDHEAGRPRPPRAPAEPRECDRCGARYARQRWTGGDAMPKQREGPEPTRERMLCPACIQIVSRPPCGYLRISGGFLERHHDDLVGVLRIESVRAARENPLARIISQCETRGSVIELTTTTPQLAQRLGHTLREAYGGHVEYEFSHENTIARVTWQRDAQ